MNFFSIQFGLFLFIFLAWLGMSIFVLTSRMRHDSRRRWLGKVVSQLRELDHSPAAQPLLLTADVPTTSRNPVITQLPKPLVYRTATDVAPYTPVATAFAEHALSHWGSESLVAAASRAGPGVDRWERISALCILTRAKADHIHELLFDALQDKDPDVVSNAIVFLGQLQDERAAEILVTALRLQLFLPSFIARQLEKFTIPLNHLLEPLLEVNTTQARYWAVALLARQDSEGKVPLYKIARLADDPDPAVRKVVVQTLGLLGASEEALVVLKLLYDDVPFVRVHAVKALARFHWPDFRESIAAMLDDPEWRVRVAAREALAEIDQVGDTRHDESMHAPAPHEAADADSTELPTLPFADFTNLGRKTPVHARPEERRS
ncbi:MAG TPA: HEAT repeat domain-containing protein [Noviherbaspirillum sp.]|uniref:HEAT repeat domain-containing protein n=1 Tax=Noviherbaspirillum sp. TaxID=1926288 RepID=UPI002DDD092D|nr:HEAT repeat domain-containing protein [Noviherbaspirillum sp.]HEV2611995.1 HEAT repeat domain-containing protein [Noviherbaspirillum sp.]